MGSKAQLRPPGDPTLHNDRAVFLQILTKVAPEVFAELKQIPGFGPATQRFGKVHRFSQLAGAGTLEGRLRGWARKYGLESQDGWCLDAAMKYLERADFSPAVNSFNRAELVEPFSVSDPGWIPFDPIPLSRYIRLLNKHIRAELQRYEAYLKNQRQEWKRCGWLVAAKRASTRASAQRHFEWLARFQCKSESYEEIAKANRVDESTVRKAVHATAARLGLTSRPNSPEQQSRK